MPKIREFVKTQCVCVKNCRGTDIKYVPGTIVHRVRPTQYLVRIGRSIRYVHVDHILKSSEAPKDMLSPDSSEAVVCDTLAVPPHVPPGILHVPHSAGLLSEVLASPRPTPDVRVPGPSVQSPTSTPTRGVQQSTYQRCSAEGTYQMCSAEGTWERCSVEGTYQRCSDRDTYQRCSDRDAYKRCFTRASYATKTLSSAV